MKLKIPSRKNIILLIIISMSVLCAAIECAMIFQFKKSKTSCSECLSSANVQTVALPSLKNRQPLFILQECSGKIGVYDAKSRIIIDVVDIFTSTLHENDKSALKIGIEVFSFEELSELIEDFST